MKISNQKGSFDLVSLFLTSGLLFLLSYYTIRRIEQWQIMKKNFKQIICVKNFHQQTKDIIKFVHTLNTIIASETALQIASSFFPVTWLAGKSLQQVKKATKILQKTKVAFYIKEIGQITLKGCPIDPRSLKSPFQLDLKTISLKRTPIGTTKLRKKKWKLCHLLRHQLICSHFEIKSSFHRNLQTKTQMTFLPRRI